MTKDEYGDFVLRYKGCGACFPMYHTLSRFEKMWFTAIQKDVAELEKENAELKDELKTLRESIKDYGAGCYENGLRNGKRKLGEQLTKAKELLKEFVHHYKNKTIYIENMQDLLEQVERFIKDSEVEK